MYWNIFSMFFFITITQQGDKMKNILVIGDTHIPFEKKGYLEFCKRIYKECNCTEVVHIGDLVDNHAISYHEHDPDLWSPIKEMEEADKILKKWFKAFPKVKLCRGNHDKLVDRKAKTVGLPRRCFKAYREIWNLPDEWEDGFSFIINRVKFQHKGKGGKNGPLNTAIANRISTVVGHNHSTGVGVQHSANELDAVFGMNVGCGIDRHKLAFAYGEDFLDKPFVSCGVVSYSRRGTNATVYPMEMR